MDKIVKNVFETMSPEEQIRRVWDREAVKNLAYKHAHCVANGLREKELDECWVKSPEYAATASYGRNWGYYCGMDEIRRYYVANNALGDGCMIFEPASTDLVHVANDGKTAQGLWYSMGVITVDGPEGPRAEWQFERICMDAVLEEGEWKIWHLFIGMDIGITPGDDYTEQPVFPANGGRIMESLFVQPGVCEPTIPMMAYTPEFTWYWYPAMPFAYESFEDVCGCGPEDNPLFGKEEK